MTAQEIFEKLGYEKNESICYNEQHILYEMPVMNGTDIRFVEFKNGRVIYSNSLNRCAWMNGELIKAINKQCQELGWIE